MLWLFQNLIGILFWKRELSTFSALSKSDCAENAESSDLSEYGFCTFWAFWKTKGAKSSKDRFLKFSEHELCTFWAFCSCKVCKMRKVQISNHVITLIPTESSMIIPKVIGFCGFSVCWLNYPDFKPFWTDSELCILSVCWMSAEKKKA